MSNPFVLYEIKEADADKASAIAINRMGAIASSNGKRMIAETLTREFVDGFWRFSAQVSAA